MQDIMLLLARELVPFVPPGLTLGLQLLHALLVPQGHIQMRVQPFALRVRLENIRAPQELGYVRIVPQELILARVRHRVLLVLRDLIL